MNEPVCKVGDIVSFEGWGCTSAEVCRINHKRGLVWVRFRNTRPGLSNRATCNKIDNIVMVNHEPVVKE